MCIRDRPRQLGKAIALHAVDPLLQPVALDIEVGHLQRIERQVAEHHFCLGELVGAGDADAAGASAQVENARWLGRQPRGEVTIDQPVSYTHLDVYKRQAFGQVPRFGAPRNRMGFAADLLDNPLPRANPHLVSACEQQCQALLARHQWHQGLAGRVRQLLLQSPGQIADMEQVLSLIHI